MFIKSFIFSLSLLLTLHDSAFLWASDILGEETLEVPFDQSVDTSAVDPKIINALLKDKVFLEAVKKKIAPKETSGISKSLNKRQKQKDYVQLVSKELIGLWEKFDKEGNYLGKQQVLAHLEYIDTIKHLDLQSKIDKVIEFKKTKAIPNSYKEKLCKANIYKIVDFYATRSIEEMNQTAWDRLYQYIKDHQLEIKLKVIKVVSLSLIFALPSLTRLIGNGFSYTRYKLKGWNASNAFNQKINIQYKLYTGGLPFEQVFPSASSSDNASSFETTTSTFLKRQFDYNSGEFLTKFTTSLVAHSLSNLLTKFSTTEKFIQEKHTPLAQALIYEVIDLKTKGVLKTEMEKYINTTSAQYAVAAHGENLFNDTNWFMNGIASSFYSKHSSPNLKGVLLSAIPLIFINSFENYLVERCVKKQKEENDVQFADLFEKVQKTLGY